MANKNIIDAQHQIRENAEDVQKFLVDLASWEKDMQKKDDELKNSQITEEKEQELPPVRNLPKGKKRNRHRKNSDKSTNGESTEIVIEKDSKPKKIEDEVSSTSENEDEELSLAKRKQLAVFNKDKGNDYFKKGNFDQAIGSYTTGMELDPDNALLPANRAMAFLKKQQFQAAENDCSLCLSIDPTYVKAYLRRGTARSGLQKIELAKEDFQKALELEPENKQASQELKKLKNTSGGAESQKDSASEDDVVKSQKMWSNFVGHQSSSQLNEPSTSHSESSQAKSNNPYADSSEIEPIYKPPEARSKKPLVHISLTDVTPEMKAARQATSAVEAASEVSEIHQQEMEFCMKKCEVTLPPIPQTSFQFLADWKKIKHNPTLTYQYLKQFPPEKLPSVFKHSMDTELFSDILDTLSNSFLENGDDVFPYMKHLGEVGRFNTLLMFMSSSENRAVRKILDSIKASELYESDLCKLMKRFNIT